MTIAIDFDHTWTADHGLWTLLAEAARKRGHQVIMVTGRPYYSDDMDRFPTPYWMPVIYAAGALKEAAARGAGHSVDIWIDDMPGTIQHCVILGGDLP